MIDAKAARFLLELVEDAEWLDPNTSFSVVEIQIKNEDDESEMYRARRENGFDDWRMEAVDV